jgi:hypothetical protein
MIFKKNTAPSFKLTKTVKQSDSFTAWRQRPMDIATRGQWLIALNWFAGTKLAPSFLGFPNELAANTNSDIIIP